jgi:hypothetical protein
MEQQKLLRQLLSQGNKKENIFIRIPSVKTEGIFCFEWWLQYFDRLSNQLSHRFSDIND